MPTKRTINITPREKTRNFFCRAFSLSSLLSPVLLTLGVMILVKHPGFLTQTPTDSDEIEITGDFLSSIESGLTNPVSAARLGIYDRLAFGKGRFLRIDGKSRRNVVLMMDSQGKQLIRLFDLPGLSSNTVLPNLNYFGGILSKAERTVQGAVEISIVYASISDKPGRIYTREAGDFVRRNQEFRQRNRVIQGKGNEGVASPEQEKKIPRSSPSQNTSKAKDAAASAASGKEPDDSEERSEPMRNKPVLKRREEASGATPPPNSGKSTEIPGNIQSRGDTDVVIYRKKEGTRKTPKNIEPSPEEKTVPLTSPTSGNSPTKSLAREVDGMMLIPEGSVTLGSDKTFDKEKPMHRVQVAAFYMDKYEVTNREYKEFCDATGHTVPRYWNDRIYPKGLDKHPVVEVTWKDAAAFAQWAGKRLPSEAEWERAAKGPNSFRYAYGNRYDPSKANTDTRKVSPVGSYPPNEFGLFDMTGNVNEWTRSLHQPYPYDREDGREDPNALGSRVLRGGSNFSGENNARCLVRMEGLPDHGTPSDGFRCARDSR